MGLLIAIVRKRYLMLMKSNAEWKLQLITQAKMTAQNAANNLLQVGTDYEADTMIAKKIQQRQQKLKALEEKLDLQKSALELQVKEYSEELQSCNSMIEANIKSSFSYQIS
jgi:C4-dicarboxylate-specific signal transduction histidine kinase